jgi:hypothetical protein
MGFGLVNRFIEHLQVVTTNNYNTIVISTLYSSLGNTCVLSVTRYFLLPAPTLAIPLPPAKFLSSQTPVENYQLKVKVKVTLRLAVYRQSVHLGIKPLETTTRLSFFNRTPALIDLM